MALENADITLSQARSCESNVLHKLTYPDLRRKFFAHLNEHRTVLREIVAHHLGFRDTHCHVARVEDWLHGSFNVCIPVIIGRGLGRTRKVLIRLPLPYRVGDEYCPGNADEKLRCEAGAYTWLMKHCPTVPIPHLYGFGLSTGQAFTNLDSLPFFARYSRLLYHKILACLRYPVPSAYARHDGSAQISRALGVGYVIIEFIEDAEMLSLTWGEQRGNEKLRKNLFQDICRMMVSLASVPLPLVASFVIDDNGFLQLGNRPLTPEIQELENEGVPVNIPRHFTYSTVDSYVADMLAVHDLRLYCQGNAIHDAQDCMYQMSALTVMRNLVPIIFQREYRRGPFFCSLEDLHTSNIMVDKQWRIKAFIDHEWVSSRPIELIHPPRWLTNQSMDLVNLDEYDSVRGEFMQVLQEIENEATQEAAQEVGGALSPTLHSVMEGGWHRGTFWFCLALRSPRQMCRLFYDHILPKFAPEHETDEAFYRIVTSFWTTDRLSFLEKKQRDKENYVMQLEAALVP